MKNKKKTDTKTPKKINPTKQKKRIKIEEKIVTKEKKGKGKGKIVTKTKEKRKTEKDKTEAKTKDKNKTTKTKDKTEIIIKRISTGIPKLDQMISGGLIPQSINLVEGGSGSGKTIFAMQYLFEGLKKGENVMYVTFEEKKENFYNNMKKLGWDLEKAEKAEKFIFLEYSPEKVKMMLDEGGGAIESLVLRHKVTRMVIDSITSFSLLFDNLLEKRGANLGLFDIIKKWNCTTVFTVQNDPSTTKNKDTTLLEFEVDGIINLYFDIVGRKRQRFIEVMKMRNTNHSNEIYSFNIDNGIKLGTAKKQIRSKKTKKKKK